MFAGKHKQHSFNKEVGGVCSSGVCACMHATRATLNKRKKGWQHPTSVCHLQCKRPYIMLTSYMCLAQSQQSHTAVSTQQQWKQKERKRGSREGDRLETTASRKREKKTKMGEKPDGSRVEVKEGGKREAEGRINASSVSGRGEIMTWLGNAL